MNLADQANGEMVDRLILQEALWSPQLIEAFRQTPRHHFLDRIYHHDRNGLWCERDVSTLDSADLSLIYSDRAVTTRLGESSTQQGAVPISSSSQPSLMAQMLEDLHLAPGMRVLEIGAGTGYNAALLARVVGAGQVTSVDVDREVLAGATHHLENQPALRIRLHHADGRNGWPPDAPYDRIMVTASTPDLERAWLEQLHPTGMLLAPLALAPGLAFVLRGALRGHLFRGELTRPAYFMPLRKEEEVGASEGADSIPRDALEVIAAPWGEASQQRRGRLPSRNLLMSLAFYGLLRGLRVSYETLDEETCFGLSDLVRGCSCWMGAQRWHVSGNAGRKLGQQLWRAFLEAGAPRPTEFDLFASVAGPPPIQGRECYNRRGPRTYQVWQLREPRDRPGFA